MDHVKLSLFSSSSRYQFLGTDGRSSVQMEDRFIIIGRGGDNYVEIKENVAQRWKVINPTKDLLYNSQPG